MKIQKITSLIALFLALTSCQTSKKTLSQSVLVPVNAAQAVAKTKTPPDKVMQRWSHLDIIKDSIPGMSVDRAYAELLRKKKGVSVIVGIVDSGVDTEHPDLKNQIWINTKEIANNNLDDDKNGYVDDVHGWNFLGDITKENIEYDRLATKLTPTDEATFLAAQKKSKISPSSIVDYRKILNNDAEDFSTKIYGNNNVTGNDKEHALHGTHVAGIVAQLRNNDIGGDGVCNTAKIMSVRAVPDGDEYDKDVALAIIYAVDNGAKVINGSFGKAFSPHKQWVFDAIKYAESKDVLIVHAAGNSALDIDINDNFPNDSEDKINEISDNLLTVGALNYEWNEKLLARFSNFGKNNVDVFAPGVKIYATTPDGSYRYLQGTSMAAPNAAGVAALVRSYYPKLTAAQVKHILMDSGIEVPFVVNVAGKADNKKMLTKITKSGKIVNAYNALLLAEKMTKEGKKSKK